MRALILAGGRGTRLNPYTDQTAKPMLPLCGIPILEILLCQLRAAGVCEVVIAVSHLGHTIEEFFGDGSRLQIEIEYFREPTPLGTAGSLGCVIERMGADFLMLNSDLLTSLDFGNLIRVHRASGADATIATTLYRSSLPFGVVHRDAEGDFSEYSEKPSFQFEVSMGVNVFRAEAVRPLVAVGESLDLPALIMRMKQARATVHCRLQNCYWLDIGRVDDYHAARVVFEQRMHVFLPAARPMVSAV